MVKQDYKWVGQFFKDIQNSWIDLLYYTLNMIPTMNDLLLKFQNEDGKECYKNFKNLPQYEQDYIKKYNRFSFKNIKKIIVKGKKPIPSNELTKSLNLFRERGLLKKDRGDYIPLQIINPLLKIQLVSEIKSDNSFPYSFNFFTLKGIPFEEKFYPELNNDLIKLSKKLIKMQKRILQIQKRIFKEFMTSFYKQPDSKKYRIENRFRIILKNLDKDILKSITHPLVAKVELKQERFNTFLSLIFSPSNERSFLILQELDNKSKKILFNYLFEIFDSCPISHSLIVWNYPGNYDLRRISEDYNKFMEKFYLDIPQIK